MGDAADSAINNYKSRDSPLVQTSKLSIKYTAPNLLIHSFHIENNEQIVSIHVISMDKSVFLWIGKGLDPNFADLSLAMISPLQKTPLATKVVGSTLETASVDMSSRLSNKLNKQVYLSCNIPLDRLSTHLVEKQIMEEIKKHPEKF